ncbi:MAG: hypothetical protein QOJ90_1863 [Actinomycetota bacterium]|jgi:hypothetical protein|nr:hypothetical protein [Actinomycetota bacterium]
MLKQLVSRLRRRSLDPDEAERRRRDRLERDLDQARADDHVRRRTTGDNPPGANGDGWV